MATSFDTLRAAKRLKGLGFNEDQAEGVADILRESRDVDLSHLATKADLDALRLASKADLAEVRREIAETKADVIKWTVGVGLVQGLALVGAVVAILRFLPGGTP